MKYLFVIIVCAVGISAQTRIDSLYNKYLDLHSKKTSRTLQQSTTGKHEKCTFGIESEVRLGIKSFSPEQQKVLKALFVRPILDTSIVSPSGFFRIHFNKTVDAPNYDINELANAFDSSYSFEVNYLGFLPPPRDLGNGGDDKYDVYVHSLHGDYGGTSPEEEISSGSNTFYSYIEMENGFVGYPTSGIAAAKVTAAHELHHAIQMGEYILRGSGDLVDDRYFYELTSTAMEEFVFDDVNDYYYYLKTGGYFNFTDKAFGSNDGYNLAIWNIFLKDKFGYGIIKRQWELMRTYRALEAVDRSLVEKQSSFLEAYKEFGLWTFYTSYRAVPGLFFDEAANYPPIKPFMTVNYSGYATPVQLNTVVTSTSYLKLVNSLNSKSDTLYFVLSNFELESGMNDLSKTLSASITLSTEKQDGFTQLAEGYYFLFKPDNPYLWKSSSIINNIVINDSQKVYAVTTAPFPSPYRYGKNDYLKIPFVGNFNEEVSLKVFSVSMDVVYEKTLILFRDPLKGEAVVEWNGLNNKNEKLASGVYVYFIKSQERTALGKLVIVNE
ncbi:MAG: MXAN_6640 family putative metalloprotease [Ignavibacteriaceae bacterium]